MDLTEANLSGADLSNAILATVDVSAANLQAVVGVDTTVGDALYNCPTLYYLAFDPVAQAGTLASKYSPFTIGDVNHLSSFYVTYTACSDGTTTIWLNDVTRLRSYAICMSYFRS